MRLTIRWQTLRAVLRDAWPVGLFVVGLIIACAVGNLLSKTRHDAVLYTGIGLQMLGLAMTAIGLILDRRIFDGPSFPAAMLNWFRRLAGAFTGPKTISVGGSLTSAWNIAGKLRVARELGPGATLDQRVSILEENLNLLRDELDTELQGVRRELGSVKVSIEHESQERRAADEKTGRKIEELAIGGQHLEWVGLLWLFFGFLAGTFPDGIAEWLP